MQTDVGSEWQMDVHMCDHSLSKQSPSQALRQEPLPPMDVALPHKDQSLQRLNNSQQCRSEAGRSHTRLEVLGGGVVESRAGFTVGAFSPSRWSKGDSGRGLKRKERNVTQCVPLHVRLRHCRDIEPAKQDLRNIFAFGLSNCSQAKVSIKLDKKRLDKQHASHV